MDRKQIITTVSNQNVVILLQDSVAYVQHHSKVFYFSHTCKLYMNVVYIQGKISF